MGFCASHFESLAYRYLPATDDERKLVERFFPPGELELRTGDVLNYDCEKISHETWSEPIYFGELYHMHINEGPENPHVLFTFQRDGQKQTAVLRLNGDTFLHHRLRYVLSNYCDRAEGAIEYQRLKPQEDKSLWRMAQDVAHA